MVNSNLLRTFHGRCVLCGDHGRDDLCLHCAADLPRIESGCQRCGLPLPAGAECGQCLRQPPPFARCLSPFLYLPPVSQLITAFKYEARFSYGRVLSRQLLAHLRACDATAVDVLLPVPLHWRRRWDRGFNQAEMIADELGRALDLPAPARWLRRELAASPQQELGAAERARNLRAAFSVKVSLEGLRVALIDDVVTTGATASELTRTLLAAGAASVQVWSLARTPR